jgi:hypothetical protein
MTLGAIGLVSFASLIYSGGEIRPPFGGWVTLSAGIEFNRNTGSNHLVTNFAYKFGFPSLF